ncbi:flagellar basal-body rod protein FlgG [Duganella sacchari]|uniref:Flagellar basal-body rod protein FlgG n=1 Tax=Duganella sacchari TaxID=551987 RepID=A0A1M7PLV7_9BURK|nr:flagellar basal-body rod protein FlgG [Duganella sacchari]SHN18155.1 flagellar basal-body rod protein FlgG [Duganella sacchari]
MNDAFYIGATGMQAQQMNVDTIANNLVNTNTTAFKKARLSFTDLVGGSVAPVAGADASLLRGLQNAGAGVGVLRVSQQFDAGDLKKTEVPLDLAIQGDGFLEVSMPDGSRAYTRGGSLKVNRDGLLATANGYPLKPAIAVPETMQSIVIGNDGRVQVTLAGQSTPAEVGQLELVRFLNPAQLDRQGDNLYRATDAAGAPLAGDGAGQLMQGFLETSNVKMVDEMTNLMLAQRAYESSLKVVQASDELLAMVNNMRK